MAICKYFSTPRGCSKGSAYTFQHGNPQWIASRPSLQQPRQQQPRVSTAEHLSGVPRGFCKSFWETARCSHGVRCKYKHDRVKPGVALVHTPTKTLVSTDFTKLPTMPVFDREVVRRICTDEHFRFHGPNDVYPVVGALWASTKETAFWVGHPRLKFSQPDTDTVY